MNQKKLKLTQSKLLVVKSNENCNLEDLVKISNFETEIFINIECLSDKNIEENEILPLNNINININTDNNI